MIKIENKYGFLYVDEDNEVIHYQGWAWYETFLEELKKTHPDLHKKLKAEYLEDMRGQNPYMRVYIPELDDNGGREILFEEWKKKQEKIEEKWKMRF